MKTPRISVSGRVTTLALAWAVFSAAQHVHAVDVAGDDAAAAERLDQIVVTAGRRAETAFDAAAGITAIDAEAVAIQAPQMVADLLRGQVGAHVQQTTPGQANIIVRGLKGSEVLHLVDGTRVNNAFFRNAPNQYLALVDAQNIDRVEVLRGPASTLYGGDAMGGVVHILTPEPRFEGEAWSSRGRFRAGYASADVSRLWRLEQAVGRDGLGVSVGVTRQDVGARRIGGGERLPFTDFTAEAASFRVLVEPAETSQWLLAADLSRQPSTPRHDALVPGFGQTDPESALFLFEPNQRRFFHLRHRWLRPTALWDSIQWHLARQVIDDDRRSRDFGSPLESREQNRSTLDSFSGQMGRALGDRHELVYGWEFNRDVVRSARQRRNIDTGAPPQPATSRFPDGSSMDSMAVYANDSVALGEATEVIAGLRYSRYRVDLPPADRGVGVRLDFDDVTGSIGVVHALSDGLNLVANVGRGFRPPNVFDLGTLGERPGNRFNRPNPDLGPESLVSVDLGVKWRGAGWDGEVFVYRTRYRDRITSVLTGETDAAGRQIVENRNAARMRLHGVEAGLGRALRDDLRLTAALTFTRGEEQLDGPFQPADRIPPLAGSLALDGKAGDAVQWNLSLRRGARQDRLSARDILDPRIDPSGTPAYTTLDARVVWTVRDNLRATLRLDNAADRRYREHGSGLDAPGRSFGLSIERTW
ncbi:MAG TPA: TonB-dependent receptor [Xanthomonadaceae bacterium]|nr:TonB-dependent receptor [Xanthomonadaceae bacterium]